LLRLRGELRAVAGADVATVEAGFEEAIALAREIGTKLAELRATTGLARPPSRPRSAARPRGGCTGPRAAMIFATRSIWLAGTLRVSPLPLPRPACVFRAEIVAPVSAARAMAADQNSVASALSRTCARSMKPPRQV
jgi:hypothetical protein